jgi:hypothetical protein
MKIPITERIAGTTIRTTWVNSGTVPGDICSTLRDKTEALVDSMTAIQSGTGMYYGIHTLPKSSAWYVNEWISVINARTYVDRQFVRAIHPEVD